MSKEIYFGIAIEVLGNGTGVGLQMTGYFNPTLGWTIIGVSNIIGLGLIIYGLHKKGDKTTPFKQEKYVKATESILERIHKRTLALKDKAFNQFRLTHNFQEFLDLHKAIMQAIGTSAELKEVNKGIKRKRLSKDMEERRAQLDELLAQVKPTLQIEWSLDTLKALVNTMDRLAESPSMSKRYKYNGLDTRVSQDKKWNKLFDKLQHIKTENNDNTLSQMIDEYVDWVRAGGGYILWTDIIREYIRPENLPSEYLGSEAYNPYVRVENTITKKRGNIVNRLKELQIMSEDKIRIEKTEIKTNVKNADKAIGMEVNKPAELYDVKSELRAENVKEAIGFSTNQGLISAFLTCPHCKKTFPAAFTGQTMPNTIKCKICGREFNPNMKY